MAEDKLQERGGRGRNLFRLLSFRRGSERKLTATKAWLLEEGGAQAVAQQVREAIDNVQEALDSGDEMAGWLTARSLEQIDPEGPYTARTFFDMKRGNEETRMAVESGLPREQIFGESGVHGQRFFIKPTKPFDALSGVMKGIDRAIDANEKGLRILYNENKDEINCEYGQVREPQNIDNWRRLIANHKTNDGRSFKDWHLKYDARSSRITVRDPMKMHVNNLFEIDTVAYGENIDRHFNEIVERSLVGKVILFQNEKGLVDSVEVWTPHFTCDEVETRMVAEFLGDFLKVDNERDEHGTNILRAYTILDEARQNYPLTVFDVETSFRVGEAEAEFIKEAAKAIDMNQSAFFLAGLMASEDHKTGYICVGPNRSSGLQFGLMTISKTFESFRTFLKRGVSFENPFQVIALVQDYPMNERIKVNRVMEKSAKFAKNEIEQAKKGYATINTLGAYIGDFSRRFFKFAFQKQTGLISDGSAQVSSVNHRNNINIKNSTFITALNITSNNVLALKRDEKGLVCDLRIRTDRLFLDEVIKRLKKRPSGYMVTQEIREEVYSIVGEKKKNLRKALALLSLIVLRQKHLESAYLSGKAETTKDVYDKFVKVATEIESS